MIKIIFVMLLSLVSSPAFCNPDYAFNVWLDGTNVTYSICFDPPCSTDIFKTKMRQFGTNNVTRNQAVFLIVGKDFSFTTFSNVCLMIKESGLTNIILHPCSPPIKFGIKGLNVKRQELY
jgi:hypothetical protein